MACCSPSCSSPPLGKDLLTSTIFGMNRLSIKDSRPRNILSCLEADRSGRGGMSQPGFYRQLYIDHGLATADKMYTADIAGHHSCVNAIAFSNLDEEYLVSGGDDQRVLVWKVGDLIHSNTGRPNPLAMAARHQPEPLTMAAQPKPLTMAARHQSNVFSAAFSCDNQYVYSGGDDHELIKHDFATGQSISHHEHLDAVYSVAPHPTLPSVVVTASEDGCVYTVDTREPQRRVNYDMVLCEGMFAYHCAAINPVEPRLVVVCNGYTGTSLYDARQKKKLLQYKMTDWPIGRQDAVSASFNSTGCQLYVMHRTLPPSLFDLWDEMVKLSFMDNTGCYKNMATMKSGCFMGQNDEYVVSGSDDFRVYVWKIPYEKEESSVEVYPSLDKCISIKPHLVLPGHRSIVNQTCYSKHHHLLATSGVEKVIKVWSNERLNSSNTVSMSGAPPSRSRYSQSEVESLLHASPVDPLAEDPSILAFFDSLLEEGELTSYLYDSSSSDDDEDLSHDFFDFFHRNAMMELPFYHYRAHTSSNDSDATPTDSELSFANTSSLEPPWSDGDLDDLDDELRETYGSSSGSDDQWSNSSSEEEEEEERGGGSKGEWNGRTGRISDHHDCEGEEEESGKEGRTEVERACASSSRQKNSSSSKTQSKSTQSHSQSAQSHSESKSTGSLPPRKMKRTDQEVRSVSSASEKGGLLQNGVDSISHRRQPERKVKSAQANPSDGTKGMNSEPSTSSQASVAGSSSRNGACGSGPSSKWTRKRRRREQEAAGTTSNYEQYTAEDFIKAKSPSSFYSKKKEPPS